MVLLHGQCLSLVAFYSALAVYVAVEIGSTQTLLPLVAMIDPQVQGSKTILDTFGSPQLAK